MPIDPIGTFNPRAFDGTDNSSAHAAGPVAPGGGGITGGIAAAIQTIVAKVNEVVEDGINALPLTASVLATATTLTIAAGAVAVTLNSHKLETEAAVASDDLDTVTGGTSGQIVFVRAANDAHSIVLKHGTGNLICPYASDVTLAEDDDLVLLFKAGTSWIVCPLKLTAPTEGGLAAALASTSASLGASLVGIQDSAALITATTVEAALAEHQLRLLTNTVADPGNAGAIAVTKSGVCLLTSAGAETRTLAIPTFLGQQIYLVDTVHAGNIVITASQAINQAGNTIMTFGAVRDTVLLTAISIGGSLRWQVTSGEATVAFS